MPRLKKCIAFYGKNDPSESHYQNDILMKKILLAILVLISGVLPAQTDKRIDSKISGVTVFLNRAQVTRVVQARLESGKTNLVIHGLTAQLDPQSIQVAGKGKFTILGITHQRNFIHEFNIPPALKQLQDSVEYYSDRIKVEQNLKEITIKEEQLLMNNQKIGGADRNLTAAELKAMADFYRSRLAEIGQQRMNYEKRISGSQDQLNKLQKQLREQNDLIARGTSEVIVSVAASESGSAALELKYVVHNAGWTPVYDIRAGSNLEPVQLNYKARVHQRTGEDWRDVRFTLSTGNPALGGSKPDLQPWYIDFPEPVVVRSPKYRVSAPPEMMDGKVAGVALLEEEEDSDSIFNNVEVVQGSVSTEFAVSLPYTVTSSGVPTILDVSAHSLPAQYTYYVAPKIDADAFLTARLTGWEELGLLPGEANIFMEGTFVAKSFLNPNEVRDTLTISLGRDRRVVVRRDKVKDLTSRRVISSNKRETYAFDIEVRNTRNQPVDLVVEDHIPVSRNSQIEVDLIEAGTATHTGDSGKIVWVMVLKPGEQRKVHYRYEVKYPKDKFVSGL